MPKLSKLGQNIPPAKILLREAGLRVTKARILVLSTLISESTPMSHNEFATILDTNLFDRTTIYRCLIDLTAAKLLRRIDMGDRTWRFEANLSDRRSHPHFFCNECGVVACLPSQMVVAYKGLKKHSPIGKIEEILIKGSCNNCGDNE